MATISEPLRAPVDCGIYRAVSIKQTFDGLSRFIRAGHSRFRPPPFECVHWSRGFTGAAEPWLSVDPRKRIASPIANKMAELDKGGAVTRQAGFVPSTFRCLSEGC